jgi:glutamate-1-semialdehyde 2,1-aminomutase
MSGFRASLKGASGIVSTVPDIVTFGKVIGAGMPVGAFASCSEIMDQLSPNGAIYQAGTLSGNPVAMAAGLKSLQKLKADKKIYKKLNKKAIRLTQGMKKVAKKYNIPLQVDTRGSMFGFFFCDKKPTNMKEVGLCDFDRFSSFHSAMLKRGFYFACSQYETGFICDTMTNKDIDNCLKACDKVMANL